MQRSIPYRNWLPSTTTMSGSSSATSSGGSTFFESYSGESNETYSNGKRNQDKNSGIGTGVTKLVSENAIIVIATCGCCMCYVIKNLLLGLGVNPTIFEVNKEDEEDVMKELSRIVGADEKNNGGIRQFPAVFVGGKLLGGLERVISTHISGELIPTLKEAGALWL